MFIHQKDVSKGLHILVTGPQIIIKPSQLPGEYTACAAKYVAH